MTQSLVRPVLVKSGILLLALFSVDLAFTNGASSQKRTAAKPPGISVADLFSNNCARCHGADGAGKTPLGQTYNTPDFTDPEWWLKNSKITSTQSLVSIVSRGKGGMPAFRKKLTATEIRRLVDHVRRFRSHRPSK
jgi:mono/diheme cytochrome c family protein